MCSLLFVVLKKPVGWVEGGNERLLIDWNTEMSLAYCAVHAAPNYVVVEQVLEQLRSIKFAFSFFSLFFLLTLSLQALLHTSVCS